VTPDAAAQPPDATAEATADAGEAFVLPSMSPPNESNRAWMRHLIAPIMSLDMSECRHGDPAFYDCWCRLVCGVRLEASDSTITISWPYNEAGGPGFKAAPDGHIEACWHTGAGLPETHLTCPPR
jgi:hypothetical protein